MAAHEKEGNQLETVLEERRRVQRQVKLLVGDAITSVTHDLKTRYGLEVFFETLGFIIPPVFISVRLSFWWFQQV